MLKWRGFFSPHRCFIFQKENLALRKNFKCKISKIILFFPSVFLFVNQGIVKVFLRSSFMRKIWASEAKKRRQEIEEDNNNKKNMLGIP